MDDNKDSLSIQQQVNKVGLTRNDYRGTPSTLCKGCGHNSIANQIIAACYELNIHPEQVLKFSGIGCSSKSPTYFLGGSFGFNGLHGRMPSLALGASFANTHLRVIGVSGDGDTASIGFGQFKHLARRNIPMVYIVENNGVYALTKGQFSATTEKGLTLKKQGVNPFQPIDICLEALTANASFVARSFAGDPRQLVSLLKAALSHRGIAILDVISPCVTFHNQDNSHHSFTWVRENKIPVQDITYIAPEDEIMIKDFEEGTTREIELFDGSTLKLKKVGKDYDPTDKFSAYKLLTEAIDENHVVTGLIYINPEQTTLFDIHQLPDDLPLNRLPESRIRPPRESIDKVNKMMF
ncbi:2-oxoacid:ferredoxin oxidoreductase subunit beta [bacterium]|nr:2-oxoacid:ferredoxin oxidoreductase subunit beta [bacterium]